VWLWTVWNRWELPERQGLFLQELLLLRSCGSPAPAAIVVVWTHWDLQLRFCCCTWDLKDLKLLLLFPYGLQDNSEGVERSSKGPAYIMQCRLLILLPFTPVIPISRHYFCRSESIIFPVCNLLSW
jgi:hypothetical protein